MAMPVCVWFWWCVSKESREKSHCLFWQTISPGLWTSVCVLLHLWLAWNLPVIRCYGFDSKFSLDEQCYSSMVKVISLQQRGLSFPSLTRKEMDSGSFSPKQLSCSMDQAVLWSSLTGNLTRGAAETEHLLAQQPQRGQDRVADTEPPTESSRVWCVPSLTGLWRSWRVGIAWQDVWFFQWKERGGAPWGRT